MMRCAMRKATTAVAAAAATASGSRRTLLFQRSFSSLKKNNLPPNLHIDPRSSFSPPKHKRAANVPIQRKLKDQQQQQAQETAAAAANPPLQEDEDYENSLDEYNNDDWTDAHPNDSIRYAIPLPDRLHVDIHTLLAPSHSTKVGTIWLDETVFGLSEIRLDLIKRAVDYYRNKLRGRRKAVTKTIGQVSGSGRKRRKQKGTGMARMGHSRPPHHRGGAKAHGPKNATNYGNTKLNKKVRLAALRHTLSQKLLEGNVIVLNQLYDLPSHKTAELARLLEPWDIRRGGRTVGASTALILDHYHATEPDINDNDDDDESVVTTDSVHGAPLRLWTAAQNLPYVTVGSDNVANVLNLLRHDKLVLTLAAVRRLEARLSTA